MRMIVMIISSDKWWLSESEASLMIFNYLQIITGCPILKEMKSIKAKSKYLAKEKENALNQISVIGNKVIIQVNTLFFILSSF